MPWQQQQAGTRAFKNSKPGAVLRTTQLVGMQTVHSVNMQVLLLTLV
jgi:hypothetical protein